MVMKSRTLQLIGSMVALSTALTLSGCSEDPDPEPPSGGNGPVPGPVEPNPPGPEPQQTAQPRTLPPDNSYRCPGASEGHVFVPHADLAFENAEIYGDIRYCSNGHTATLENKSDGVWAIDPSIFLSRDTPSPAAGFFRHTIHAYGMHPENVELAIPGEIIHVVANDDILNAPDYILWAPDYVMSGAWKVQEIGVDRLMDFGTSYVDQTLKRERPTHHTGAVAQCTLDALRALKETAEIDAESDSSDHAKAALSGVNAWACIPATAAADEAARAQGAAAAGQAPDPHPPVRTSFAERVHTFSNSLDKGIGVGKLLSSAPRVCIRLRIPFCT